MSIHFARLHSEKESKCEQCAQKLEQNGERLHKDFNDLEWNFRNQLDLPKTSFYKIRQYERLQSTEILCYPVKKKILSTM